jgi:hypothetical protein
MSQAYSLNIQVAHFQRQGVALPYVVSGFQPEIQKKKKAVDRPQGHS